MFKKINLYSDPYSCKTLHQIIDSEFEEYSDKYLEFEAIFEVYSKRKLNVAKNIALYWLECTTNQYFLNTFLDKNQGALIGAYAELINDFKPYINDALSYYKQFSTLS